MTKQEFEKEYKSLQDKCYEKYALIKEKYNDVYACTPEQEAKDKYGDDYLLYLEFNNLYIQQHSLFKEYETRELKSQNLYSDNNVDLSVAIEVHDILIEKGFYKEHLDKNEDFDYVKVIYNCLYNDNWNDLLVAKLQLFKSNVFLREIVIFDETLFEDKNPDSDDLYYKKEPFEIEMYDCRIYSNNEAYQSFFVHKDKLKL
jgi:hypothetical protein